MFKCRETIALNENKRNVRRSELINYLSEMKWYLESRTCFSISPPGQGLQVLIESQVDDRLYNQRGPIYAHQTVLIVGLKKKDCKIAGHLNLHEVVQEQKLYFSRFGSSKDTIS